ncbi:cyclic nucleotide-binding domain protein (macronuclear) [Tetrahymena thermophila SB210]|uniref:Cyclic nucleotide-binding domain protein n=1 Tax=Tetrahymena thermophila (strain SB210) TaxID=312017 RepID=Q228M8_TETTS|nr:cyclic nucleotide-binding domain protein [Tetrahymena thermophila SB210]EAR81745.2 cyclic nucleotide-binding domain protein [Tetrahymena thermophila SB210]|eukprot:XP_001029408.2 cyclic nucleotide-binding domain protein [Tetrahymena thermophila SB210]
MTTIGYGDIVPITDLERIYISIVSLISCGLFGYFISQIKEIVGEIQRKSETFNKKMQALNKLMNSRQLNKKITYQVIKYYEYLHKQSDYSLEEEGLRMIDDLPKSMSNCIKFEINHKYLYSQKIFSLNFMKPFLNELSLKIKLLKIGPDFKRHRQKSSNAYQFYINSGSEIEKTLKK